MVRNYTAGIVCVWASAVASAGPAPSQTLSDRIKERVEPVIERVMSEQNMTGLAIGFVENGHLVYARGFGRMNVDDPSKPVTTETLFHMASITKPFVMTAVVQLVEQGKIDLDAGVSQYLPYFRLQDARYQTITVRQMLTHTSGMPDVDDYLWNKPEYDDRALERYVRSLTDQKLLSAPGAQFAYSNMAYEVLGDLVAKVSGGTFEDYVDAHILKPVGMSSSTLLLRKADPAKLAAGHTKTQAGAVKVVDAYPYNRAHTPSSNLHSNVVDMARWAIANMNRGELDGRRILKSATYDLVWMPAARRNESTHVGLSWFLTEFSGQKAVMHGGGDDGFRTMLMMFPEKKVALLHMTNCDYADLAPINRAALNAALDQR